MERKEFSEGDEVTCPRCLGDDLDYAESPDVGKCYTCGLVFEVKTVVIWDKAFPGKEVANAA